MEKIISIEETTFSTGEKWTGSFDGFQIVTDQQRILVGINNSQDCCENWGYASSEDNFKDFEGADLISIDVVDKALNKKTKVDIYEGDAMFVNFETSAGTLQFVMYNEHNGYYGHEAVVISKSMNVSEIL